MFFGPFLPIVPILILLEQLPESIGGPIQEVIINTAFYVLEAVNEILGIAF